MKKHKNPILWFFTVVFLLYGLLSIAESPISAIASILLSVTLCPLIWKNSRKNVAIKKSIKILLPTTLFFITIFLAPVDDSMALDKAEPSADSYMGVYGFDGNKNSASQVTKTSLKNSSTPSKLEVHFLDVGQGDSTLIMCGESAMLIDAADDSKGTAIQNYLQRQGIKKLDYFILTHPDADHIGAAPVIITKFDVDTVFMSNFEKDNKTYQKLIQALDHKHIKYSTPEVGNTYGLGDAAFEIIAPNKKYSNPNDSSIGFILKSGETSFIFTGDAEETAEEDIVDNGIHLKADVYHAGHHGSDSSSTLPFLDAVEPAYAVISCGEGNSYGHPRAETLNNFRSKGIKVFRTDEQGTIVATSDGETITWNCSPSVNWKAGEPMGSRANGSATAEQAPEPQITDAATSSKESEKQTCYVLNTKSKKFHRLSCNSLPTANREDSTLSRSELVGMGYAPCKRCHP